MKASKDLRGKKTTWKIFVVGIFFSQFVKKILGLSLFLYYLFMIDAP